MDPSRWWDEVHDIHELRDKSSPDEVIARIATQSGGVVDRAQLATLGLTRGAIDHRILVGRLRPYHRGVYAVGHEAIQLRGRLVAALLAAGPGAALSHLTAAALWKLIQSMPQFVEVTTARGHRRSRRGVVLHRATTLDATKLHDLPITTPIRTLQDLAATRPGAQVERACSEALVQRLVTAQQLAQQRGRGAAALARLTSEGVAPTRSELERRFLKAVLNARLPQPEVNARIDRHQIDFLWREQRLVVELDGWRFHGHRLAFERDRGRDAELGLLGFAVVRFTWRQARDEPAAVTARAGRFLSRPASSTAS
jgi:very-short-patch-repair endonuclease